jgi:PAS domain S-box-containing protein
MTAFDAPARPDGSSAQPSGLDEQSVFRSLFAAYPDALLIVDQAGMVVLANPAAALLLGFETHEFVGLNVDTLVPDSIRPRHASYREAYARSPRPRPMGTQMELVAKRKDGSEVMVEIALSPLENRGLPYVVAAIRDIGAYPRVKQALQRARYSEYLAQLGRLAVDMRDSQDLLQHVPDTATAALQVELGMVLLLESDELEFRVASAAGTVGFDAAGRHVANRADTLAGIVFATGAPVAIDDLATQQRIVVPAEYLDAGLASALAVPLSDRGRTIGALIVLSRSRKRFGKDEVGFMESLANLLATSLQRAQTQDALNHAQRLESVGQLTGGIAHDFNNLLTVIQGNLQVLEELPELDGAAYAQQLVGAATRATRRAAELTSKLLAFSRRQVLQPTRVDAGTLLRSLADMLRRTLDQRIAIELDEHAHGDACTVVADPGQLESAMLNIAINARDAMPAGGTLRFRYRICDDLPVDVRQELLTAGREARHFVALSIADTGSGMSAAVRARAFEPFFTTKEAGRGTGLGLSTVHGFVKQSRGAITIDSVVETGTVVTLYLPRPIGTERLGAADDADGAGGAVPRGLRVLLVEDDAEVRAIIRTFLVALGCEVTASADGEEALRWLVPGATLDLLVTDIALGAGIRGTQLAAQAQRVLPQLAILLMSGFSSELLDADRDSPSDWELLRKPCSRGELASGIAKAIGDRPRA